MASKTVEHLNLSKEQIAGLEDNFNRISKHPDGMTLMLIATECGLTEEDTIEWFKLRNAKWRQEEGLPAKLGSVLD